MNQYCKYHTLSGHIFGFTFGEEAPPIPLDWSIVEIDIQANIDLEKQYYSGNGFIDRMVGTIKQVEEITVDHKALTVPVLAWVTKDGAFYQADSSGHITVPVIGEDNYNVELAGSYYGSSTFMYYDLNSLKIAQKEIIRIGRDLSINKGVILPFLPNSPTVQSDESSRGLISGAVLSASILGSQNQPFSIGWRMLDNSTVTLSGAQMIQMGLMVMQRVNTVYQRSFVLNQRIVAATTVSTINAIVWTDGD